MKKIKFLKKLGAFFLAIIVSLTSVITIDIAVNENGLTVYGAENTLSDGGSRNNSLISVPTPGTVTIDGDLSDWDWSGRIKIFEFYYEVGKKDFEIASMYDSGYLYLAAKVKDETPLNNPINPVTEPNWTWRGDGFQNRVRTDGNEMWMDFAYHAETDISSLGIRYFNTRNHHTDEDTMVYYRTMPGSTKLDQVAIAQGNPDKIDKTGEMAWVADEDGKGYSMEAKVPWNMIAKDGANAGKANSVYKWAFECKWTNDINKGANSFYYVDLLDETIEYNLNIGESWGDLILSPAGNVETRNYVVDIKTDEIGSIYFYPKVPKSTKYLTLVMDDQSGNRVANIISEYEVTEDNIIAENSDSYTVKVPWNGKGLMGDYVPAGKYVVSGLTHEGVRVFLDYTAFNPGTPGWKTQDGKGSWLSDHTPPMAVASNGDQTFIGANTAESGFATIAVGPDGKKQWGILRGARFLAASDDYLYAVPGSDFYFNSMTTGNTYITRMSKVDGAIIPFTLNGESRPTELTIGTILDIDKTVMPQIMGFAAYEDMILLATGSDNLEPTVVGGNVMNYTSMISVLDAESAVLKKRIPIPNVGQIAFSRDGKLYAVSGDSIVLVNLSSGKYEKLPITLDRGMELGALTVDKDGNVVVFDKGEDLQIKAYNPKSGQKVYTIGKKGGRALIGKWDPSGFTHMVRNISADDAGHIWVPEYWDSPRRTSVWNTDGTLHKDYIGSAGYQSAGVETHDTNENLVYWLANEMTVDHTTKTWEMSRVLWVPDFSKNQAFPIEYNDYHQQHFTRETNGVEREYIFGQTLGNEAVLYMENDKGYFQPVMAMGTVGEFNTVSAMIRDMETYAIFGDRNSLKNQRYLSVFDGIADSTFYVWNDYNGDAAIQIDECEFTTSTQLANGGWGQRMTSDFRFMLTGTGKVLFAGGLWMITPDEITEDGIPRFSLNSMKHLEGIKTDAGNHEALILEGTNKILIYADSSGSTVVSENGIWVVDMDQAAKTEWWYLNQYPGVHGSHSAPVNGKDGTVVGPIKNMGVITVNGEELFALKGNYGQDFFMTTDGYYIQTIFNDGHRTGTNQNLPDVDMDPLEFAQIDWSEGSETGECWGGFLAMHNDGVVRMGIATGGPCGIITRLEGLETIDRIDAFDVTITMAMLEEADEFNKKLENMGSTITIGGEAAQQSIFVNKIEASEITIDGDNSEWSSLKGVYISDPVVSEKANAKLAHDGENLYAMFYVNDRSPMANKGAEYTRLFKTGDVCDIQLSPTRNNGNDVALNDMRIIISEFKGEPIAVLMQQKSTSTENRTLYGSPVMDLYMDNVEILKDAELNITKEEQGGYYIVEAKIPFKSIDLDVKSGETLTGDLGFISSDEAGNINTARTYYFNKETGLISDLPTETRLVPRHWGTVEFE